MNGLRLVAVLGLVSTLLGCAHVDPGPLPHFESWAPYLPRDSASATPFQPERLRGKVVLVTFVSSWCFPCLADFVTLTKLQTDLGPRGFANVLVGMDLEGHRVLDPFAASYSLQCPLVVSDERLRAGQTPFGHIRELPTRFLFGRDGRLVDGYTGIVAYEALERVVKAALEEPTPVR